MSDDDKKVIPTEELEFKKLQLEVKGLSERVELEKQKLSLEVKGLQHGFRRTLITALLTASISMFIAVAGWTVQRRSEEDATRHAEKNHREEVFAKLLENLGSANPSARMSAAVALSSFGRPTEETADQTIAALTNRLAVEDDLAVDEQIIDTLVSLGKPALHESARANPRAAMQFVRDSGTYVGLLMTLDALHRRQAIVYDDETEAKEMKTLSFEIKLVGFPLEQNSSSTLKALTLKDLLRGQFHQRFKSDVDAILTTIGPITPDKLDNRIQDARDALRRSTRFFLATSIALERELRSLSGSLRGEKLDGITLLGGRLEKIDLTGVSFQKSFVMVNAREADLSFCDFTEANIEHMYLAKARLRGATLTKTIIDGYAMGFDEEGQSADLMGANWWDSLERQHDTGELKTPSWMEESLPRATEEVERQKLLQDWNKSR